MIFHVTKENIKKGKRKHGETCPVALAINTAVEGPKGAWISVARSFVILSGAGEVQTVDLPANIIEFIQEFDDDIKVEPTTFKLPDEPFIKSGFKPKTNVTPQSIGERNAEES